ncbi:tripartite motif-containing protein 54 [Aplysia californica]|uniref:Tripartite motif-containing protein 54 n=1 Tax=Aplysia californica TaxID=6500 RepID=A0ABM0JGV7_APLCA|nr:tripartite motif-containing protein 54 [Aplysia californica]
MTSTDNNAGNSAMANDSRGGGTGGGGGGATVAISDGGRALIVDEAYFEEQFLRCQVCNERFDQSERMPKSLPCNHTFCLPCLTQIFDHAQPPNRRTLLWADETLDGALKCPTCRVEIFLARIKIKELPNDHRVVQMIDFLSQAVAKSHNVCSKHERQPLNFFCKKCLVPVCRDCTVLDHKETEGHNITDVSEALNDNSAQFTEIENNSRLTLEKMKARSDALANASKSLDILDRRLKSEIKETFIEYRLLLEKRQEALTSMVHQIVKDQKALINTRFVEVCEHGTQLQKLYDEFKASKNSNDIRKLFTINQEMKDHEAKFTEVASQEDTELFQSCEFEAQNDCAFLTDMSSLGEVRQKADPGLKEPVSAHQLVYLDMEEQRERQRRIDNQIGNYGDCDEAFVRGANIEAGGFDHHHYEDSDEAGEAGEADDPRGDIPHLEVSRLISRYMREVHLHEDMEGHEGATGSRNRRSYDATPRRGRRNRDTNSSQVSSSLAMQSPSDFLRAARAAEVGNGSSSSSSSGYPRPGSRSRSGASTNYRVVRHQNAMRQQGGHSPEDSN